jgi:AraC-like DNA-binding protein
MMATIHELMYYRDVVLQNGDPVSVEMGKNSKEAIEEKRRFKEMDKRIIKEELFLSPDFGREDLMRLMGVDKNAIASIIQKYANTNVAGYIKMKRMEYAVNLLKEHPELTIAAIAEMCGIKSTTTFVNHFKDTYGITPSDYRISITTFAPPSNR